MKELKKPITWCLKGGMEISEVYESGLQYAFCAPDFKQQRPWVYCKDFLHDTVFSFLNESSLEIYGYTYDPKVHLRPFVRRMRLLLRNRSDKGFAAGVERSREFLNLVEKAMGMPSRTRVFRCPNPPKSYAKTGIYLFSGSGDWLLAPPMVSCYALMVRAGFAHVPGKTYMETIDDIINNKVGQYQEFDADQLSASKPGLKRLVNAGYRNVFAREMKANYPPGIYCEEMHNNFGFVAFSAGTTAQYAPGWHKKPAKKSAC